jgi:hypothetical protein
MGMFDTIRSSYDLGPGFWRRDLQTKGLECLMVEYWIDPSGQLFEIDYSGTQDFDLCPEQESKTPWNPYKAVPNGNHGKVRPVYVTATIEVYPAKWECHYAPFPRKIIQFVNGKLNEEIITCIDFSGCSS